MVWGGISLGDRIQRYYYYCYCNVFIILKGVPAPLMFQLRIGFQVRDLHESDILSLTMYYGLHNKK